jgi:hypothetical protein
MGMKCNIGVWYSNGIKWWYVNGSNACTKVIKIWNGNRIDAGNRRGHNTSNGSGINTLNRNGNDAWNGQGSVTSHLKNIEREWHHCLEWVGHQWMELEWHQ